MSKVTTIEDVLKRNIPIWWDIVDPELKQGLTKAMQEWASLQTPSNEKYWRERCEAAEELLKVMDIPKNRAGTANQQWELFGNRNDKWQQLKSTPIPIQTPCGWTRPQLDDVVEYSVVFAKHNDKPCIGYFEKFPDGWWFIKELNQGGIHESRFSEIKILDATTH